MTKNKDNSLLPSDQFEILDIRYEQTPWYRRAWFIIMTMLLCTPITLVLLLSGDVYVQRDERVYKIRPKRKNWIFFSSFMLLTANLISFSAWNY
ncbi:hypothetical protein BS333_15130 [Vibrio azureus]|nr:hypothetical protein BS333_15130 [Vibrio azureus]